jgi:dUTP pyrophosphatase
MRLSPTRGPAGGSARDHHRQRPGTIDEGYRGEILVNLVNLDPAEPFEVRRGDRIAQLVVQRVAAASFVEVDSLSDSSRGETGHGSSGGFGPRA